MSNFVIIGTGTTGFVTASYLAGKNAGPVTHETAECCADVIVDIERAAALVTVQSYLENIGINYNRGRYGDWGYMRADERHISAERAAESALSQVSA